MPSTTSITVEAALVGEEYELAGPLDIILSDGFIKELIPVDKVPSNKRLLAMPSLADAHNHARPLSTSSFGCAGKPLETWLPNLALMPSVDAYTAAAASFARSLGGGATSVMVHLTRPMGLLSLPDEAREIARAADDVGVSIGFAIGMRDRNPLVYGDHENLLQGFDTDQRLIVEQNWLKSAPAVADQISLVDAVAEAVADMPGHIDVQYGPNGAQWCSDELLVAIAEASTRHNRRVHMHLLETSPQRRWADSAFPEGLVSHLDKLGLLTPRLTLAHCVWARPAELRTIAERGCRIAVNASSNLHLHSGVAAVPEMIKAGVDVAMGLDGCALDEDDDGLRELRLFYLLNCARGYESGGLTIPSALRAACASGRKSLGLDDGGVLEPGMPADLLLLDLNSLDRDALMTVDARDFLIARATKSHIVNAFARGRQVMGEGQVTGVDLQQLELELRASYRVGLESKADLLKVWPALEDSISEYYASHFRGCC